MDAACPPSGVDGFSAGWLHWLDVPACPLTGWLAGLWAGWLAVLVGFTSWLGWLVVGQRQNSSVSFSEVCQTIPGDPYQGGKFRKALSMMKVL